MLTVLCIFYLIVITIDWYDGVIRLSDTFYRQIAIDGRYRDFPIWSFVIPSIVLMAWKIMTVLRKETVPRSRALHAKALSFGRLLGYDGSTGYVRMTKSFSRMRPILPEIVLSLDADPVGGRHGGDRGGDQALRRRRGRLRRRPTAGAG